MSERDSEVRSVFPTEAEEIQAIEGYGLADPEMTWLDANGNELALGCHVRVARDITLPVPTAYAHAFVDKGMRIIDFGQVVQLHADGGISVKWVRTHHDVDASNGDRETSRDVELSTKDEYAAFDLGLDQGWEDGFRAGHKSYLNEQRESLGLPRLSDEQFNNLMIIGAIRKDTLDPDA